MSRFRSWYVGIFLFLALLATSAATQALNRAALVVRFGDGEVETACVSFSEAEISGHDLLERAGLSVEAQEVGMGASVCRIEDVGCGTDNCFCHCRGGTCEYWSYWQMRDGAWQYSTAGASISTVTDGDIQGWSWGPGSVSEAVAPPVFTFADVCENQQGTGPATPQVEAVVSTIPTAAAATGEQQQQTGAEASARDTGDAGAGLPLSYIGFAVSVLLLIVLAMLARRRHG